MRKIVAPILFLSLSNCVVAPPPYEEYTLARAAVRAAQDVDAARFSVGYWNKADENFRLGQKSWKDAEFDRAKLYFKRATDFAERAENATRLKKFQSGDTFP